MFLVDAALALPAALETTPTGFHFENLVATDVAVWKDSGFGRAVYYRHTGSGQEVDFVLNSQLEIPSTLRGPGFNRVIPAQAGIQNIELFDLSPGVRRDDGSAFLMIRRIAATWSLFMLFYLELNTYLLPDIISAPWRAALWRSLCTRARAPWPSLLR